MKRTTTEQVSCETRGTTSFFAVQRRPREAPLGQHGTALERPREGSAPNATHVAPDSVPALGAAETAMPPSVPYVLVADWTASGSRLAEALRARGHHTILVRESSAAVALAQSRAPVAVVSELRFSDGTGFDVIEAMRAIDATVPVVIVTAYASTASAFAVIRMGARDCLCKPATPDEVLACSGLERNIEARVAPLAWPTLAAVAQRYIQDTCELAGSITKAARLLGVDRRSLKRRMARYARLSVTGERSLDTDRLLPPHATAAAARRKNRPL